MTNHFWTKIRSCKVAVFVLQHCHIKNVLTNSLFLKRHFLPIPRFSKTTNKIKRLSRNWNFFDFMTFQDFQGPWKLCLPLIFPLATHPLNYQFLSTDTVHPCLEKQYLFFRKKLLDIFILFESRMSND